MDEYEIKDSKGNVHTVKVPKGSPPPSQSEVEALMGGAAEKPIAPSPRRPDLAGGRGESISGRVPAEDEVEKFRAAARGMVDDEMKRARPYRRLGTNKSADSPVTAKDIFQGMLPALKNFGQGLAAPFTKGADVGRAAMATLRDPSDENNVAQERAFLDWTDSIGNLIPFRSEIEAMVDPNPRPDYFKKQFQQDPAGTIMSGALVAIPALRGQLGKAGAAGRVAATERGVGAGARFASMLSRKPMGSGPSEIPMAGGGTLVLTPEGVGSYEPIVSKPDLPAIEPVKASPFFTANRRAGRRSSVDLAKLEPLTDDPLANTLSSRIADEAIGAPDPNVGNGLPRPTEFGKRSGGRISDQFANTPGGAVADWLETRLENIDPNLPNALTPEESLLAVREVGAYASGRIPRITKSTAMLLDRAVGSGWRETLADATKKVPKLRSNSVYSESLFYDTVDSHFGVGPNITRIAAPEGSAGLGSLIPDELKAWDDLPDEVKWSMDEVPREGLAPPPFEGGGAPLMGENSRAARGGRGRPRLTSLEPKKGVDPKSARGRFEAIAKIANAPRDLMYGFELSAMGRQAAKLGLSNPKAYVSAVKSGFRALKSDELAAAERAAMGRSPYADLHKKHGLATSDAMAEEFRPSLIDDVKGLGPASKRFKEHFEVTIEKMRQETFDRQVDAWKKQGFKPQDRHFNELADYVNTMTGRGDLGILDPKKSKVKAIQNISRVLDETMASPRLQASYLNAPRMLLDPRISKPMRVKAAREMGIHIASTAGLVALAKQAGFKVEEDPTRTNWGKIEVPGKNGAKTYVDLWGGYQPWARLVAQEAYGKKNGKPLDNAGRFQLLLKRGESTLAPTPGLILDTARGKDFTGQDVTLTDSLAARAWPIAYQDVVAAIKAHGGAKGSALGGLALLGVNVSTYEKRKKDGGD